MNHARVLNKDQKDLEDIYETLYLLDNNLCKVLIVKRIFLLKQTQVMQYREQKVLQVYHADLHVWCINLSFNLRHHSQQMMLPKYCHGYLQIQRQFSP